VRRRPGHGIGALVKLAQDRGWTVQVIATPASLEFFDKAAIQDQTGNPVRSQYAPPGAPRSLIPDAILVAPATYKWAQGISDTYALGVLAETTGLGVPTVVLPFVNAALASRVPFRRRFTAAWERAASLRLRSGDASTLDEYDQHGRIRGAPADQAMDQAVHPYVASYLDGRDVLLMAANWARCRELSTRIRGDLIHLGLVESGRTIRIAGGAKASAGDVIICRRNDHGIEAGEPGRTLANGDVLRIDAVTSRGIMVRCRLDPDGISSRCGS
jgi:hypothetical protein